MTTAATQPTICRVVGVTLLRALCTAMLKRHAMGAGTCGIVPRTRRELPVSSRSGDGVVTLC